MTKENFSLKTLYDYYVQRPESKWSLNPLTARYINKFVKENKIKKVLDLGTGIGCSAAITAYTLLDKGVEDFEIHTVEQNEKIYKIAQEIMPEKFKKYVKFYLSEPIVWETEKIPYQYFSIFKELPEIDFDFVFVDGTGPFLLENNLIDLPNGDVMKLFLENKIKAGTLIAWDKRLKSIRFLERYFADNFYLTFQEQDIDFNVLERKEGEVIFRDDELKNFQQEGYF